MPGRWWHVVSRVVDRRFVFGEVEREMFSQLLRRVEVFSGVEVITWTMLSNHFHIVLHVPEAPEEGVSEAVFWERLTALYGRQGVEEIRMEMESIREMNPGSAGEVLVQAYRERFVRRMHDLSAFMKTLVQRFTTWFNQRHERVGRLWESRFKSLLIEGEWGSVIAVAAYVDLNAVRAGLVEDPKDYRWCGYAEAVAGRSVARRGLVALYDDRVRSEGDAPSTVTWREVSRDYRKMLYGVGSQRGLAADGRSPLKRGMTEAQVAAVMAQDGSLSLPELLRHRVRYFTDGAVFGSREFIDGMFRAKRGFFGENRQSGARKMRGGSWEGLYCLRDLKKDTLGDAH
jgi:hypothetical protein